MAWTHQSSAQAQGTSATPAVTRGFVVTPGDLYFVVIFSANPMLTWPAGWQEDGRLIDTGGGFAAWGHKQAQSVEPASYSWSCVSGSWSVLFESFRHGTFDPTNCNESSGVSAIAVSATTIPAPRPLMTTTDGFVVYAGTCGGNVTVTVSAGATILQTLTGAATAWEATSATGQTATRTFTFGSSQPNRVAISQGYIALAPPAAVVHTLSGSGVQAISNPVALAVSLAGIPSSLAIAKGNPTRYFGLGNIAFGNANGYFRNYYLEHAAEQILSPLSTATLLAYSFASGITATVTELTSI